LSRVPVRRAAPRRGHGAGRSDYCTAGNATTVFPLATSTTSRLPRKLPLSREHCACMRCSSVEQVVLLSGHAGTPTAACISTAVGSLGKVRLPARLGRGGARGRAPPLP